MCSIADSPKQPEQLATQLEKANQQLLQSEKLAAIGQLAAGVAHEINNPVGYVCSNLQSLQSYLADLFSLSDSIDGAKTVDELRNAKQNIDYDYVKSDIEDLISETLEGLDRVKKIISAMKDFSHIDEEEFKSVNLHDGIETTLNVVNNELKYRAEVVRDFGPAPNVECIPSQINQVVMNLLVNAAHAIDGYGRITIRTGRQDEAWAWIEVEDNGVGIPRENLNRLYEPFFTTKPIGKGTGLGLALSYNIVEKHHGRIEVDSTVGRGTIFRIWLPVHQQDSHPEDCHQENSHPEDRRPEDDAAATGRG